MSDASDGGSSDSDSIGDSSSDNSSDTSASDPSSSDGDWSDQPPADASWSGGGLDTTWGDPFPADRPADLPADLLTDDPLTEDPLTGEPPASDPEREATPWVPPDAPPPPSEANAPAAAGPPPSDPGYSPHPGPTAYPAYSGTTAGSGPTSYPSAYGAAPPPPAGFPPAAGPPGAYPSAYGAASPPSGFPPAAGAHPGAVPPGYGPSGPRRRTSGFAAGSLALALIGVFFCFVPMLSILAVVFGHVARSRITRSEGVEGGRGIATAGLVIGYLTLAASVAFWAFVIISAEPVPEGDPPSSIAEFGTNSTLDGLARDCADEDFAACDRLWLQSPRDSGYEEYGATCGGRVTPDPSESSIFHERCTDRFGE